MLNIPESFLKYEHNAGMRQDRCIRSIKSGGRSHVSNGDSR